VSDLRELNLGLDMQYNHGASAKVNCNESSVYAANRTSARL